jgi:hypothetical protein
MESGARYEHLERALVLCVRLARTPLAYWDEQLMLDHERLKTVLRVIYGEIALLEAAALPVAVADEANPGYLITSVEGVQFHVPFHLFETLPAAEMLQELAEIAKAVRANESSTICISGSCANYSKFGVVSDVDLCEYVDGGHARTVFADAIARAEGIDGDSLLCFGVHLFDLRYNAAAQRNDVVTHRSTFRPWSSPPSRDTAFTALLSTARKAKFDFLADTRSEGMVVVTNIALITDGIRDHVLLDSYAAQELPLGFDGSVVPRQLAEPLALGRYVEFLCEQIDQTLSKKLLAKAAKRAHSLARLLTRNYEADAIVKSMRTDDFFIDAAIAARLAVARHIEGLSDRALREKLTGPMVETLKRLCSRAVDPRLTALLENDRDLDDLPLWINNLDHYMQTKTARVATIEADLREFVEEVKEQIAGAGT